MNNEITIQMQNVQKEEWKQPQLIELDISETESGLTLGLEFLILSA